MCKAETTVKNISFKNMLQELDNTFWFFSFWFIFIYFHDLFTGSVGRNCRNNVTTVWQNILNCVRKIAFKKISDEFLPEFGFPTVVCSNKQFTLYHPCSVKILIITIIILCSLFQTLRNKMNHNSMNAT